MLLVLNQLKARGLLFYLAATSQPHTRDQLATLLWGESGYLWKVPNQHKPNFFHGISEKS